jgi:hypothetical protein
VPDEITAWMSITVDGNRTARWWPCCWASPSRPVRHQRPLGPAGRDPQPQPAGAGRVLERVRLIKGIASTETSIHLQSYKLG